ncbi:GNAT family N-acetyltransferase [Streptomyces sp. NPDC049879]|uniref:GNAT family N-acetyltransferase n=1 Tax=Streptomyces sp. NPDC049879 TaxID=3365598 RepID=UPI003791F1D4
MIRSAEPADTGAVVELAVTAGLFGPEEALFVTAMMAGYFGGAAEEGHRCLVDDADGLRAVAYRQPKPAADRVWDLTMIAVRPGHQGRGIGTALLRHVEEELRGDGQRLLLVDTSGTPPYDRARTFYAGCGYAEEARVRDYWADGDDLVVFRKALT